MSNSQFSLLISALTTERPYTLTGADDYPVLIACLGLLLCLGVYIWQDIKYTIREHRKEWRDELTTEACERKEQDALLRVSLFEHKKECTTMSEKG